MRPAHCSHPIAPQRGSGFTLVELLVVIAIIALLMGIVLPSLAGARDTAKTMHCSVNLRSIGQALLMYADDNDEWFPSTTGWHTWEGNGSNGDSAGQGWTEQLREYMSTQEVYVDKSRPLTPFAYFLQGRYPLALINRSTMPWQPGRPLSVRMPAVFFTTQFVLGGDNMNPLAFPEPYGIALNPPNCDMDDAEFPMCFVGQDELKPHRGTANLLFMDGHVDGFRRYEQGRMTWDGREMRDWGGTQ